MRWMSSHSLELFSLFSLFTFCLSPEEFLLQTGKDEARGLLVVAVGDCLRFGDNK
jgi:hypothetical protein